MVSQTFTSSGSFVVPIGVTTVNLAIIGGGGGGGNNAGGGGGAGGVTLVTNAAVTPGNSYTVTVGSGGAGGSTAGASGGSGSASSFGGYSANGGGGGGGSGSAGANGGSGGGSGGLTSGGPLSGGSGTGGQGYGGGTSVYASGHFTGSGGGGYSNYGGSTSGVYAGGGGSGYNPSGTVYAAGGGGGCQAGDSAGPAGGTGAGAGSGATGGAGGTATANTGSGGGGGGGGNGNGGAGGSGIVIVSWTPSLPIEATLITDPQGIPINTTGVFNVKAYGALGDGSTNDNVAIAAAISACALYSAGTSKGTLYFPAGTYLVSAAIAVSISGYSTMTIKGDGRMSSIILQTASATDGMTVTLTSTSNAAEAVVEVSDLGFLTNTTAACALRLNYSGTVGSTEDQVGVTVRNIHIGPSTFGGSTSQGWNNGLYFYNCWKINVDQIDGFGGASNTGHPVLASYANYPTVGPTTGKSVPGGGALITMYGGININVTNIYGSFWSWGVFLGNQSQGGSGLITAGSFVIGSPYQIVSTGTTNFVAIGAPNNSPGTYFTATGAGSGTGTAELAYLAVETPNFTNVILVAVNVGCYLAPGYAVSDLSFVNWGIDQGAADTSVSNFAFYLTGDPVLVRGNASFFNCSWTPPGGGFYYGWLLSNMNYCAFVGCTNFENVTASAVNMSGCTNNTFTGCIFGGGTVELQGTSNNNSFAACDFGGGSLVLSGPANNNCFSGCNFGGGAITMSGSTCNNNIFSGCFFGGSAISLSGSCGYNVFDGCIITNGGSSGSISFGSGCNNNAFNNTQSATITNSGTGNITKTTLF